MLDRTDRHQRRFMRLLTRHTLLYTEMITTQAILHGDRARHLDFHPVEHPIALQLGGDDPQALATCARIATDWGYDEINLNVGCPSDRVQQGQFGACLMLRPERVAACVDAMRAASPLPITVKHRIGVDHHDHYEDLLRFVDIVAAAGADRFTAHARKAWLKGLSPKENRTVPPLRYAEVWRLKRERPALPIEINGGILTLAQAQEQLAHVDAVMIGRAAYDQPMIFAEADALFFNDPRPALSLTELLEGVAAQIADLQAAGDRPHFLFRHLLGLFNGRPGARQWRRTLSQGSTASDAGAPLLWAAAEPVLAGAAQKLNGH